MFGKRLEPIEKQWAKKRQGKRNDITSGKNYPEVKEPKRARDKVAEKHL